MIERIYLIVSSQTNVKRISILEGHGQPQKFIGLTRLFCPLTLFTLDLFCVTCLGEGGGFNHFKCF